jgi:sec-independent protein translocase protein TatA
MTALLALGMPNGIEWVVILFVVLILFGAKRLPELARGLGKSMSEFKKAREDFETELHHGAAEATPSVTVREPENRQLAYSPGGVSSASVEQQVRELQEQLKEMQRQNELLQKSTTPSVSGSEVTVATLPRVATPAPPAGPTLATESTEPPQVSVKS